MGALFVLDISSFRVAKAEPKSEPFATPEQMAAKDAAVTQCLMQQDVPVMGFGMKVVCVKKEHVAWIR
jgi:hypothetical protein